MIINRINPNYCNYQEASNAVLYDDANVFVLMDAKKLSHCAEFRVEQLRRTSCEHWSEASLETCDKLIAKPKDLIDVKEAIEQLVDADKNGKDNPKY